MSSIDNNKPKAKEKNPVNALFNTIICKIKALFKPEEVEVTFERKGNNIIYHYTVVEQKQVA